MADAFCTPRGVVESLGRTFTIERCIGRGGFGEVYRAEMVSATGLATPVALKVLRADLAPGELALRRLRDEGLMLARLDHPTILRVHDLILLEGRVSLVTEFVEGEDLEQCLQGVDPIGPRALVDVVGQVASALDAAWNAPIGEDGARLGLVHRDVKPSNVRISLHGEVKLLDFGIARSDELTREARTVTDTMVGSPPYMAPERFLDAELRSASDVFSLGTILLERLTGRRVFDQPVTVIAALAVDRARFEKYVDARFAGIAEDAPPEVVSLARDLMAYTPEERPAAAAVARRCEALGDVIDGPSLTRWCRERRWRAAPSRVGDLDGRVLSEGRAWTTPLTRDPPTAGASFLGRQTELEWLCAAIDGGQALVTVVGPGGIGKTALVREAAALARVRGWSIAEVDLTDLSDPALAVLRVAAALELRGDGAAVARALAGRAPCLLVLDDVDALVPEADALAGLVGVPGVTVLVTSREALGVARETLLRLAPLDDPTALRLLRLQGERAGVPRDRLATPDLPALAAALEGLPLAIVLAGPWLSWLSPAEVAARLSDLGDRAGSAGRHGSLAACIGRSWDGLEPADRRALSLLSSCAGALPLSLCEALLQPDPGSPLDRIARLERRALLTTDAQGRVRVPPAVRGEARLRDLAATEISVPRAFAWAGLAAAQAVGALSGLDAGPVDTAARDLPLIEAAIDGAARDGTWVGPACDLVELWVRFGLDPRADGFVDQAVALATTDAERARALHQRSRVAELRGVRAWADLDQARDLAIRAGSRDQLVRIRITRGVARRGIGEFEASRQELEEALPIATGALRAMVLIELAALARSVGTPRQAVERLVEAQAEARRARCPRYDLLASGALASCERELGRTLDAELTFRRALGVAELLRERENLAHLRSNLANLLLMDGRAAEAATLMEEAAHHYRRTGNLRSEAFAQLSGALAQMRLMHAEEALRLAAEARDGFRACGHRMGVATADGLLGRLLHHLGRPNEALARYDEVVAQWEALGLPAMGGRVAAVAALAAADAGDLERAHRDRARAGERLLDDPAAPMLLAFVDRELARLASDGRIALRERLAGPELDRALSAVSS